MTSISTETDTSETPKKGGVTLLEMMMSAAVVGTIVAASYSYYGSLNNHAKTAGIITSELRAANNLETCSVLVNTTRHEGKCGSYGPYTALIGGKDLYVFRGSKDDPTFVGGTGFLGFRATQELIDVALAK